MYKELKFEMLLNMIAGSLIFLSMSMTSQLHHEIKKKKEF